MKCVLINPVQLVCPPFGLLQIASVLEAAGCLVKVRELQAPQTADYGKQIDATIEYLHNEDPDIIGITCMAAQRFEVRSMIRKIRESSLRGRIIVGGVHASFMPEEVMSWGADFVVIYEGEETILELLDVIRGNMSPESVLGVYYREGSAIIKTSPRGPVEDLSKLPLPAYHLVDRRRFTSRRGEIRGRWSRSGWIMTSRGCPSTCTFCSAHKMFGKRVRYRSMDHIFSEIALLVTNYRIETLVLMDDTFTVNRNFVAEFCKRIKKEYPRMFWNCQARVNLFDDEYAKLLKNSNCIQVDFGVESGSQKVLDRLKKGIKVEDTIRAFEACRKYGLRTVATIMVGNPGEDVDDLEMTKKLLRRIRPDFYAAYFTTPFPGTDLYEEAKNKGVLDSEERYWHQDATPVPFSEIDIKELERYVRKFTNLNIVKNYLFNPVFLFDMLYFGITNPSVAAKIAFNIAMGNSKKALSLVANSVYFKMET
ncbi:MAG: B12-binding domain-containing radical SAM protein [Candidatus Omnitrophica bacterium]|nr:B12-binding domain-containing radical SAM protein [Candidatus Omnitrophota bacterium]